MKLHSFCRLGCGFGVVLLLAAGSLQAADPAGNGLNPKRHEALTIALAKLPAGAKPVEFVLIPAGSFRMGCELTERGRVGREFHPHEVTITRPFYFGRYEVTQAQWWAVMGTRPAQGYGEGDDYPVYHVTWNESQEFIARLNALDQGRFRLPTEAEWEYGCRAGTQTRFWFGDALDCSDIREFCEQLDAYMWWGGNNGQQGYPLGCKAVGLKTPNPWGVHDPHGNVWEWCSDWWGDPEHRGPQRDPQGPPTGTLKVMRGGAWESHALHLRSADRSPIAPDGKEYGRLIGFRLVREWP